MATRGLRSEIAVVEHIGIPDTILSGALAGIIGGVLSALFAMGAATLVGDDILSPFRLTGATFIGANAATGGPGVIAYGLVVHLVMVASWGALFAAILPREATAGSAFIAGLVYGLIVMLVMLHLVLPVVNPVMRDAADGETSFLLAHLIYGGSLATVPMLRRQFAHP